MHLSRSRSESASAPTLPAINDGPAKPRNWKDITSQDRTRRYPHPSHAIPAYGRCCQETTKRPHKEIPPQSEPTVPAIPARTHISEKIQFRRSGPAHRCQGTIFGQPPIRQSFLPARHGRPDDSLLEEEAALPFHHRPPLFSKSPAGVRQDAATDQPRTSIAEAGEIPIQLSEPTTPGRLQGPTHIARKIAFQ